MSSGDRGGASELTKIIKASKTPIICICNDTQANSVKTLLNHCFHIKFTRPMKETVAKRLVEIGKLEGIDAELNAMTMLVESVGNDIRQAINSLEMLRRSTVKLSYTDMKSNLETIKKDDILRINGFEAATTILGSKNDFNKRMESFFVDYDLIPMLVHGNYPNACGNDPNSCHRLSMAADDIVDMDIVNNYIYSGQHWGLLTTQQMFTIAGYNNLFI